jgi:4-hydroxy-3-polyprenylbenzoate decarboxylase
MVFPALGDFIRFLESKGELRRIKAQVDPHLEVTQIAVRALREQKPALLFENVKGCRFPLAVNVYASAKRLEMALGRDPGQIGRELIDFADRMMPPTIPALWKARKMLARALKARGTTVASAMSQEIVSQLSFDDLPIQVCWPKDGGRFITQGEVVTYDPVDGKRNIGMYRMHVFSELESGMHWQIQKGGGFHFFRAEQGRQDLEVAVALGTDPALLLASIAALPEGMDEAVFAAFLRGSPTKFVKGSSISIDVPASAEFVLEGIVPADKRRNEGPFGDHFGHYSHAAPFPVFRLQRITHRRNPVYPATVVGIPPMEDKFLGDATQRILGPLARLIHKEVREIWAYYETGFHNLLVVSVEERYHKEAMKAAFGLLGTGQLSLTKCLVMVSEDVDPRNWPAVLREIRDHFDPHFDYVLLPKVPLDTLDFTSFKMELGSKMIVDATRKKRLTQPVKKARLDEKDIRSFDKRIHDAAVVDDALLLVKVSRDGRRVIEKLVQRKELRHLKIIAAVSDDVDVRNEENYLWGVFTRFDCERDVLFTEQKLIGISPIYKGVMGIDATWKKGYPEPLVMDERIVRSVDSRWNELWKD